MALDALAFNRMHNEINIYFMCVILRSYMDLSRIPHMYMRVVIVFISCLILIFVLIMLTNICEDKSTAFLLHNPGRIQYISARLMQCKYHAYLLMQSIPYLFVIICIVIGIIFKETLLSISTADNNVIPNFIAHFALLSMTLGPVLLVRFDYQNAKGRYCYLHFTGYTEVDTHVLHGAGVVLLLWGVFVFNLLIANALSTVSRDSYSYYAFASLLTRYKIIEVIYLIAAVIFFVAFGTNEQTVAASLEYALIAIVLIFVILCYFVDCAITCKRDDFDTLEQHTPSMPVYFKDDDYDI